jgi:transposase
MLARKKKTPVVITAIARELVGFVWAIAREVQPKQTAG